MLLEPYNYNLIFLFLIGGFCIQHVFSLINVTPVIKDNTPFELIYHTVNFKVFGCLSYACTLDHCRSEFDPRERQCAYLGNSAAPEGYY